MAEISIVLVYALEIKYNYILSLKQKRNLHWRAKGGLVWRKEKEGGGRGDNMHSALLAVKWPII